MIQIINFRTISKSVWNSELRFLITKPSQFSLLKGYFPPKAFFLCQNITKRLFSFQSFLCQNITKRLFFPPKVSLPKKKKVYHNFSFHFYNISIYSYLVWLAQNSKYKDWIFPPFIGKLTLFRIISWNLISPTIQNIVRPFWSLRSQERGNRQLLNRYRVSDLQGEKNLEICFTATWMYLAPLKHSLKTG